MKKALFILSLVLICVTCKEDDPNNPGGGNPNVFTLETETTSVIPVQLITLTSPNISFTQTEYEAKLGTIDVTLYKNPNNDLVFIMPEVASGSYSLDLVIDEKNGSIIFNVGVNTIANVEATLEEEILTPFAVFQDNIDTLLSEGGLSSEQLSQLNSAKQMDADFQTKYATLTSEEKMEAARFFNANPIFSTSLNRSAELLGIFQANNREMGFDCLNAHAPGFLSSFAVVVIGVGLIGVGTHLHPAAAAIGIFITLIGGYIALQITYNYWDQILDCVFPDNIDAVSNLVNNNNRGGNEEIFFNDQDKRMQLIMQARHLIRSDVNSSSSLIAEVAQTFIFLEDNWTNLSSIVNNWIGNISHSIYGWLGVGQLYEPLLTDIIPLPESSPLEEVIGDSGFLYIDSLPSDVIGTLWPQGDGEFDIRLLADENTLPRSFPMKLRYEDEVSVALYKYVDVDLRNLEIGIGSFHQGGIVFRYYNGHGKVVSLFDQSSGIVWGCRGQFIYGTNCGSQGAQSTNSIVNGCTTETTAADVCFNLELNGYSDWYLPECELLRSMLSKRALIDSASIANGGSAFSTYEYWTSSQSTQFAAFSMNMDDEAHHFEKDTLFGARAVRDF